MRDASGDVINNQLVGIRISLLQNTTIVYQETYETTTNDFGLINLVIGNGTVTQGTFSTLDWVSGPYFIELEIDILGGSNYVMMGSQQLVSVPYALYAETSGSSTPGPQGPQGITGNDGADGATGAQGPTGSTGNNATIYAGNGITISNDSIISQIKTHIATISTTNDWTNQITCVYFDLPNAKILGVYIQEPQGIIVKYDMGSTNWGTVAPIWNDMTGFASIDEYVKEVGVPSGNSGNRWPWAIIKAERTGGSASTQINVWIVYMD